MNHEQVNVALITDANYFNPALVTIKSMLDNTNRIINVKCILTEQVNVDVDKIKVELNTKHTNSQVEFIYFDDSILSHVKTKFHVSRAAYVKIYLPEILDDWNKCLFLDSDLLVVKDIGILWDTALVEGSEFELAAVWNPGYNKDNKVIGLEMSEQTFNSGVMVMDLFKMRANDSSNKLAQFIKEFNHLTVLNDQAAFNAIYKRNWESIPLEWNVQFLLYLRRSKVIGITKNELKQVRNNPAILHFTTSSKPWKYRSVHPYKKEFLAYFNTLEKAEFNGKITGIDTIKRIRERFLLTKAEF